MQNSIQANLNALQQASYGGGYGYQPQNNIPNRFGGPSAGTGSYAGGGSFSGTSGGGSTGSFGGINPGGQVYGGTTGGHRPSYSSGSPNYNSRPNYASSGGSNFASAGGSVSSNGHSQQHAAIYPANPVN